MKLKPHYYQVVRARAAALNVNEGLAMTVAAYAERGARPGFLLRAILTNDLHSAMKFARRNPHLMDQVAGLAQLVEELVDESMRGSTIAVQTWVANCERWHGRAQA